MTRNYVPPLSSSEPPLRISGGDPWRIAHYEAMERPTPNEAPIVALARAATGLAAGAAGRDRYTRQSVANILLAGHRFLALEWGDRLDKGTLSDIFDQAALRIRFDLTTEEFV